MATFENAIVDELEKDALAVFVSVTIHNGVKEWSAYIKDAQETCNRLNLALAHHEPFPVELTVEDDPSWTAYAGALRKVTKK